MYQQPYRPPTLFGAFPPVIKNLLIINGLVFMAQQVPSIDGILLQWFALWPNTSLFGYSTVSTFLPWQLVTYGFLHGDFTHLLFNMFALWMFGMRIEHAWGSRRFAIYYFLCVIGAGLVQLLVATISAANGQVYPTVGASGGVFGLLLAFGMLYPNEYIVLLFPPIPIKAKWFVIIFGALELYFGVTGAQVGVANFAHLGGMVFGYLLIQYWRGKLPMQPKRRMYT